MPFDEHNRSSEPTDNFRTRQPRDNAAPRLRKTQQTFLDLCVTSGQTLGEVMHELHLTPDQLARWFASAEFRLRLNKTLRFLRHTRELNVQLGAAKAAGLLHHAAAHPEDATRDLPRSACVDLIRLARSSSARRHAQSHKLDIAPALATPHADLDPEQANVLAAQLSV